MEGMCDQPLDGRVCNCETIGESVYSNCFCIYDRVQNDHLEMDSLNGLLQIATHQSDVRLARLLVARGADPYYIDKRGNNVLFSIEPYGDYMDMLYYLVVELGVDVNHVGEKGPLLFVTAVYNQDIETTRFLLESGANADVTVNGCTLLRYAEDYRINPDIVDLLESFIPLIKEPCCD